MSYAFDLGCKIARLAKTAAVNLPTASGGYFPNVAQKDLPAAAGAIQGSGSATGQPKAPAVSVGTLDTAGSKPIQFAGMPQGMTAGGGSSVSRIPGTTPASPETARLARGWSTAANQTTAKVIDQLRGMGYNRTHNVWEKGPQPDAQV